MLKKVTKKTIQVDNQSIIFYFNSTRFGYDIDDYYPSMTDHNFRMRDLVFFFHKLNEQFNGFNQLRETKHKGWLRKKAIASFIFFLMFFLPALFSMQLILTGELKNTGTIVITGIFFSSIALTLQFLVIDHNNTKMDDRMMTVQIARNVKS